MNSAAQKSLFPDEDWLQPDNSGGKDRLPPGSPVTADAPEPDDPQRQLIGHNYQGTRINQRRSDGYIDATAMCRAYEAQFNEWHDNKDTRRISTALIKKLKTGIPVIRTERGRYGGSWVHPLLAIHLAMWLAPDFAIQVLEWVMGWFQGRTPSIPTAPDSFLVAQLQRQLGRIEENTIAIRKRVRRIDVRTGSMQLDLFYVAYGRRMVGDELSQEIASRQTWAAPADPTAPTESGLPRLVEARKPERR